MNLGCSATAFQLTTTEFVLFFLGQVKEVFIPVWTLGDKQVFCQVPHSLCTGCDLHVLASGVCQRFLWLCQQLTWRKVIGVRQMIHYPAEEIAH